MSMKVVKLDGKGSERARGAGRSPNGRVLVNKRFQLTFLAFMCGSALASCAVFWITREALAG